jgi:hypothetical protein
MISLMFRLQNGPSMKRLGSKQFNEPPLRRVTREKELQAAANSDARTQEEESGALTM